MADRLLQGGSRGAPPSPAELEECLGAIAPFTQDTYLRNTNEWISRVGGRKSNASGAPATPQGTATRGSAPPAQARPAGTVHPATRGQAPVDNVQNAAMRKLQKIRDGFAKALTARADVEPGSTAAAGIDPAWNTHVFTASTKTVAWAKRQAINGPPQDLLASGLFSIHEGRAHLHAGLGELDSPIVVLRDSDGRLTGAYGAEWRSDGCESALPFFTDVETRRLASCHGGAIIAANTAAEIAAWRRLGIAAIPVPPRSLWDSVAKEYWDRFVSMTEPAKPGRASPNQYGGPPEISLAPTLVVPQLDPISLDFTLQSEFIASCRTLRDFWLSGASDRAFIASWKPNKFAASQLCEAVVDGPPQELQRQLRRSVRYALYYLVGNCSANEEQDDLASLHKTLTELDPASSDEQRAAAGARYLRQFDMDIFAPMVRDAEAMESASQRALAMTQAGLMQCFGEVQTDMLLAGAVGAADAKDKSARVRDLCRLSKEICSSIRMSKEETRGRRH